MGGLVRGARRVPLPELHMAAARILLPLQHARQSGR